MSCASPPSARTCARRSWSCRPASSAPKWKRMAPGCWLCASETRQPVSTPLHGGAQWAAACQRHCRLWSRWDEGGAAAHAAPQAGGNQACRQPLAGPVDAVAPRVGWRGVHRAAAVPHDLAPREAAVAGQLDAGVLHRLHAPARTGGAGLLQQLAAAAAPQLEYT